MRRTCRCRVAGQLLLQVGANALCGSERGQFYDGSEVTPGHEGAGIVAAAGPETSTPVGDAGRRVLDGLLRRMSQLRAGTSPISACRNAPITASTWTAVSAHTSWSTRTSSSRSTSDMTPTEATLLLDIMGTNGHGVRRAQVGAQQDIESAVVTGRGSDWAGHVGDAQGHARL